jgi:hypothetical protein
MGPVKIDMNPGCTAANLSICKFSPSGNFLAANGQNPFWSPLYKIKNTVCTPSAPSPDLPAPPRGTGEQILMGHST